MEGEHYEEEGPASAAVSGIMTTLDGSTDYTNV